MPFSTFYGEKYGTVCGELGQINTSYVGAEARRSRTFYDLSLVLFFESAECFFRIVEEFHEDVKNLLRYFTAIFGLTMLVVYTSIFFGPQSEVQGQMASPKILIRLRFTGGILNIGLIFGIYLVYI